MGLRREHRAGVVGEDQKLIEIGACQRDAEESVLVLDFVLGMVLLSYGGDLQKVRQILAYFTQFREFSFLGKEILTVLQLAFSHARESSDRRCKRKTALFDAQE